MNAIDNSLNDMYVIPQGNIQDSVMILGVNIPVCCIVN